MSRYIDAENLDCISYQGAPDGYEDSFDSGVLYAMNLVDEQPTADVVPVVHGHWIEKTGVLNDATFWWYECSECGDRPLKYYGSNCLSRFCPNCGASMDEVMK